jgi:ATP-binding cassette, subfamily B (MDR/TAP), member 1
MDVFGAEDVRSRGNFFALMFFVMSIGLALVYLILGGATNVVSQHFSYTIRKRLFQAMLNQDLRFHDRPENTIGALTSSLDAHANSVFELMGFSVAIILISLFTILICGVLSLIVSWKLGLVSFFAGIPPMVLAGYVRMRVETKMDSEIDKKFSKSASIASETVTAIRTVSSLAIEANVLQKYTNELDTAIRQARVPLMSMMVFFAFTQAVELFVLALGFWYV